VRAEHTSASVVLDRYEHLLPGSEERTIDNGRSVEKTGRDRGLSLWALLGSNQWPLPCEGSALPLS
jgi:hypothetical protein